MLFVFVITVCNLIIDYCKQFSEVGDQPICQQTANFHIPICSLSTLSRLANCFLTLVRFHDRPMMDPLNLSIDGQRVNEGHVTAV